MGKVKKLIPIRRLHDHCWKLMSVFVKLRDNDKCVTCGKRVTGQNAHASHYIHGDVYDFNEICINLQCGNYCHFLFGQRSPHQKSVEVRERYRKYLEGKWGKEKVDALVIEKHKILKRTRQDYEDIRKDLECRIAQLLAEKIANNLSQEA